MTVVEELIRVENENGLSFGDYTLNAKKKVSDFEFHGDMYKVKTYRDITKLEKNELFVYESVPEHLYSISKKRMSERNLKSKALKIRRLHWNWKLNRNMKFLWMM